MTAKQVFPAIVVLGGCAALVAATIALRLAIWFPLYLALKRLRESNHSS